MVGVDCLTLCSNRMAATDQNNQNGVFVLLKGLKCMLGLRRRRTIWAEALSLAGVCQAAFLWLEILF